MRPSKGGANDNNLSTLYKNTCPGVLLIYTSTEEATLQGTGFFIASNGIAVSNYHVFKSTLVGKETVRTIDGTSYKIERVLESNQNLDYIIFQLKDCHNNSFLRIASNEPIIGEDLFAVGNPKGLELTLSKGIASSFREGKNLIQTTTEITHGSSGGPLLNMKGEVVGITTSGYGEANLNFAINIQKLNLKRFIRE
ncbi:MAG: serine protease [Bacteroidales bacterium]